MDLTSIKSALAKLPKAKLLKLDKFFINKTPAVDKWRHLNPYGERFIANRLSDMTNPGRYSGVATTPGKVKLWAPKGNTLTQEVGLNELGASKHAMRAAFGQEFQTPTNWEVWKSRFDVAKQAAKDALTPSTTLKG